MRHCKNEFMRFEDILAIDPGYGQANGTGYAIFDDESHQLKTCGLIRPFAPGLDSHETTIEIANKVRRVWEEQIGFSYDPKILCIEHPVGCFVRKGIRVNPGSIITLAILGVRIENQFNARTPLRPSPQEWKNRGSKSDTKNFVLNNLDQKSLKVLDRDLSAIPAGLRHNVFDAVGLGMWAITADKIKAANKDI